MPHPNEPHPDDLDLGRRVIPSDKAFVLGGLVALGVILAVFMFLGRESTTTASNTPAATTGAGQTSPPPASR